MATTAKSVILRDKDDGKQLLPMTRAELVILNNGTSVETGLANKQDTLVSGTNIKTVNGESLLGSGNISVTGQQGEDGVGISSVVQTTESTVSGGTNVITVTKSDGTTSTFNVRNGDAVGSATIVQTTGNSTTSAMSQDAVTREITELDRRMPESFKGTLTTYDISSFPNLIPGANDTKMSFMLDARYGFSGYAGIKRFHFSDANDNNYFEIEQTGHRFAIYTKVAGTAYSAYINFSAVEGMLAIVTFDFSTGAYVIYSNALQKASNTFPVAQLPDMSLMTKCTISDTDHEGRKYWAVFNTVLSQSDVNEIFASYPQESMPDKYYGTFFKNAESINLSGATASGTNVSYSDRTSTSIKVTTSAATGGFPYVFANNWIDVSAEKTRNTEYKMHLKVNSGAVTIKSLGPSGYNPLYVYDSGGNYLGDRTGAGELTAGEYDLIYSGVLVSNWNDQYTQFLLMFSTSEASEFILSNVTKQRIGAVLMFGPQNYRGNYWLMPGGSKIPLGSDLVVNYDVYKPNITTAQYPQFNGQLKMDSGKIYMGYLTQLVPGVWKQINNS